MKKKLIAGNWKMNGSLAANEALVKGLLAGLGTPACDVAVAVPSPYLAQVQGLLSVPTSHWVRKMSRPLLLGLIPVKCRRRC